MTQSIEQRKHECDNEYIWPFKIYFDENLDRWIMVDDKDNGHYVNYCPTCGVKL